MTNSPDRSEVSLGGWLQVDLAQPGTVFWVGPLWTAACGWLACNTTSLALRLNLLLALTVLLSSGPLLSGINVAAMELSRVVRGTEGSAKPTTESKLILPYIVPGSLAQQAWVRVRHLLARLNARLVADNVRLLIAFLLLSASLILVSATASGGMLLLSLVSVGWVLIMIFLGRHLPELEESMYFGFQITFSWLMGYCACDVPSRLGLVVAVALGAIYWTLFRVASARKRVLRLFGYLLQITLCVLLLVAGSPVLTGMMLLCVLLQHWLASQELRDGQYARRAQVLVMIECLILSLGFPGLGLPLTPV